SEKVHNTRAEANVKWTIKKQKLRGLTRAQAVALASTGFHGLSVQCIYLDKAEKQRRLSCETALGSLVLKSPGVMLALNGAIPVVPEAPPTATEPPPLLDLDRGLDPGLDPGAGDSGKSGPVGD